MRAAVMISGLVICGTGALSGCDIGTLDRSIPILLYPQRYNQILDSDERIYARFDFPIDKTSVHRNISVSSAEGEIESRKEWSGNYLFVQPIAPLIPGRRYLLTLEGAMHSTKGRVYDVDIATPFFFLDSHAAVPVVMSSTPLIGGTMGVEDTVYFRFNVPMDIASAVPTIKPSLNWKGEWHSHNREMNIIPLEGWKNRTLYSIQFSTEFRSAQQVPIAEEIAAYFWVSEQSSYHDLVKIESMPSASSNLNESISLWESNSITTATTRIDVPLTPVIPINHILSLTFNRDIDRNSAIQNIQLQPFPGGEWVWQNNSQLLFYPADGWEIDSDYYISILDGVRDRSDNLLPRQIVVHFRTQADYLQLVEIGIALHDGGGLTDFSETSPTVLQVADEVMAEYTVTFKFNDDFRADWEKQSARSHIEFVRVLANGKGLPVPIGFGWLNDRIVTITYRNVVPSGMADKNYLLLHIQGGARGIRSTAGRYLKEDIRQLFRVELLP